MTLPDRPGPPPRRAVPARTTKITRLAAQLGLTPRAVRYYEQRGLVTVGRDDANRRVYDADARERLQTIAKLRRAGLSLAAIEEVLRLEAVEDAQVPAEVVRRLREALAALDARREVLAASLREHEGLAAAAAPPRAAGGRP